MKILLVEDNRILIELLVEALKARNYDVDMAYDGVEAWNLIESVDYDLLLLDLTLPKLDGIVICRRLRAKGYQMPVLMLTARDTLQDRITGLEAGADDYLVKPYRLDELLTRMQALLNNQAGDRNVKKYDYRLTPGKCSTKLAGECSIKLA